MAKKKDQVQDEVIDDAPVYTYVGAGESSPNVIEFMGLQKFVRGKATPVSNPTVLSKIKNNPCFVEGEVEQELIHEMDEEASVAADNQRKIDRRVNDAFMRQHSGVGSNED